mmetsp:Transcript_38079/g.113744  ORF Transcript_38079/g.113744 Transcript_38079/m.113744 type:complete len:267 (-) Transcript_38079:258-1058(-)
METDTLSALKILVTGASSGIGMATCKVLRKQGASVVGVGRKVAALQKLKDDGHIMDFVAADITTPGSCKEVVDSATEKLGGLTTLVNAAGVLQGGAMGDDAKTCLANYEFNMRVNTQAPFELMVHTIPYLRRQPREVHPSIINVSSVNGKQAFAGCVTYCMSKAALDQLTRCASVDLAGDGIRVNAVNPGVIETSLQKTGGLSPDAYNAFLKRSVEITHPLANSLGRVGQPEEVGELIAFLVSDKAKFITGETIAIDGGRQNLGAR